MSSYCTFFDQAYLPQGLALWRSLRRHEPDAVLWVLALDETTEAVLRALAGPGLRLMTLAELLAADPELAAVQAGRPRREFVFTLKAGLCRQLLRQHPGDGVIIYLDADIYFLGDPGAIPRELGAHSVLIVPHRFPAWNDVSAYYGKFNAGIIAFRADGPGLDCLGRWREECLASCGMTAGGGSYGDQKYLDAWPGKYGGAVVISANPGLNLAPWNWLRHRCRVTAAGVTVDGEPLVAFHFARFRRISARWSDSGQVEFGIMPLKLRSRIYGEYWDELLAAEAEIRRVRPEFTWKGSSWRAALGTWRMALARLAGGEFWLRVGPWWLAGRLGLGRFSGRVIAAYRRTLHRPA